jgi:hypothetical protein
MARSFLPFSGTLVPADDSNIFCPTRGVQITFYFSLNSFQPLNKMLNGFRPHIPVIHLLENKIFK